MNDILFLFFCTKRSIALRSSQGFRGMPTQYTENGSECVFFSACPDNRLKKDYYPIVILKGKAGRMNNNEMKLKIISPPLSISIAFAHYNTTMKERKKERGFFVTGSWSVLKIFLFLSFGFFFGRKVGRRRNNIYEWIDVFGIKVDASRLNKTHPFIQFITFFLYFGMISMILRQNWTLNSYVHGWILYIKFRWSWHGAL